MTTTSAEDDGRKARQKKKKPRVADTEPVAKQSDGHDRLPSWLENWQNEFPPETSSDRRHRKLEATRRIVQIAADRVLEPSAVALFGASASVVLGLGAVEATILCSETPIIDSMDAALFVVRYSAEQLLPSCVWSTQDCNLIATAMGYDPAVLLRSLDPTNAADASTLLQIQFLATCRAMAAGFMLLAQLVRAGTIGAAAPDIYEDRIRLGREPPVIPKEGGLIVRLCGVESDATATSLSRMGRHVFPVFEDPLRVSPLVSQYSEGARFPVFWCVRPEKYGTSYSWEGFPVSRNCFVRTSTRRNILLVEADATNGDDPLSLGDRALDLNIDDASQGFRRIHDLFRSSTTLPPFRTLRVYLGNSLETAKSGGGHVYTLRHRVRYAKEVDVLIDSRAPVLQEVLRWCDRVAGKDRRILFQTSSRQYFLSLQLMMRRYGYEIFDPLDWRMFDNDLQGETDPQVNDSKKKTKGKGSTETGRRKHLSLLRVLVDDKMEPVQKESDDEEKWIAAKEAQRDTLRRITKLSRLPRLLYYGKTAETVNAVQALMNAGEVDAANCCALLDRQEGTHFLKAILNQQSDLVEEGNMNWRPESSNVAPSSGLHIICSSTIYDDLFRQVRQWTRMGYNETQIQRELDIRFQGIIKQSQEVHETVTEVTMKEEKSEKPEAPAEAEISSPEDTQSSPEETSSVEHKTS